MDFLIICMIIRLSFGEIWLKMLFKKVIFSLLFWFYNGLFWIKVEIKFNVIMEGYFRLVLFWDLLRIIFIIKM